MLLPIEIALTRGVGLMAAAGAPSRWRHDDDSGPDPGWLGPDPSASGTVGVEPVVDGKEHSTGHSLTPDHRRHRYRPGCAPRSIGKFPERIRMPQVNVNLGPDPVAPHVMNASVPHVVGTEHASALAEGGLL